MLNSESIYYFPLTKIEHIKGHLSDEAAVREFVRPCRSIVVLVSHLLPSSSPEEIRSVISWFGAAFVQLLEACRSSKVDQIVFVSSGGTIYGENLRGVPVNEQHRLNPHCAYGSFCAFLEQLTRTFHNQHGLPYTILRLVTFMDNLNRSRPSILGGTLPGIGLRPDKALLMVALEDIGGFTALILARPQEYLGRSVELGYELANMDFTFRNIGRLLDEWQSRIQQQQDTQP